ncbi:MAG: mechanosensitive ion channel domain-containing protein [Myxococcota bacterium]
MQNVLAHNPMDRLVSYLLDQGVSWNIISLIFASTAVVRALVILLIFWLIARVVQKMILRMTAKRTGPERSFIELVATGIKVLLLGMGVISACGTVGIDLKGVVAGLGLTGFAIGFALKDLASNLMGGVMLLFYRPFNQGDRVILNGQEGTVENVDLRYTTLRCEGDKRVLFPNSDLVNKKVEVLKRVQSERRGGL